MLAAPSPDLHRRARRSDDQCAVRTLDLTVVITVVGWLCPESCPAQGSRHVDGSGKTPNRCRPGWENYFFPFLPFLLFLLFLLFLATRITHFPIQQVNETLTGASTYH
jgi:hypothetical protein